MAEPACPGCRELLSRVAELETPLAELTRKLDEAVRAGKRQAAPFCNGPPKPDPKHCRAARGRAGRDYRDDAFGFRVCFRPR